MAGSNILAITGPDLQFNLHFSDGLAMAAVNRLATSDVPESELSGLQGTDAKVEGSAEWIFALGQLHSASALEHSTGMEDVVVIPHSVDWRAPEETFRAEPALSRFASLRAEKGIFVFESPLALAHVELRSRRALDLYAELVTAPATLSSEGRQLAALFHSARLLSDADRGRESWSVADAAQHARSRIGFGATPRRRDNGQSVERFRPTVHHTVRLPRGWSPGERSLDEVLAARRSLRENASAPITLAELSELLFRSSREESRILPDGTHSVARLYPSGGSCHSLDLYVAAAACQGLEPALYLYDRAAHMLGRVADATTAASLVHDARRATAEEGDGQVLLILASNFSIVASRYDGMAYSLILKEVGAAIQTIHLVATALNLAACPIGSGNSGLFARALKADFFQYTSVGEILLGSAPTPLPG